MPPCQFALDLESPFAAELLESVLDAAERVGVRTVWGSVFADRLELVLSENVSQDLIIRILETKVTHPSTTRLATGEGTAGRVSFSGE